MLGRKVVPFAAFGGTAILLSTGAALFDVPNSAEGSCMLASPCYCLFCLVRLVFKVMTAIPMDVKGRGIDSHSPDV